MTCIYLNKSGIYLDRMATIVMDGKKFTRDVAKLNAWPSNIPIRISSKRGMVKYYAVVGNAMNAEHFISNIQRDVVHYLTDTCTMYGCVNALENMPALHSKDEFAIIFISKDAKGKLDTILTIANGDLKLSYIEDFTEKSSWVFSDRFNSRSEVPYNKLTGYGGEWVIELYSRISNVSQEYDFLSFETGAVTNHKVKKETIESVNKYLAKKYLRSLDAPEKDDATNTTVQGDKPSD